ncbi:hypothetical protein GWK47_016368 [Chionoecetes opilio]|uniref:Uncharacterized protein n=1 Tax=Chionoecetes opilio TaxID=41210 RepID=A0A8J4XRS5_CHIOP|nr:hypothetical protein GWK47_016368 [Chionoecetes opilio]
MPHSPISRTEGGSVSAIKNFLFGGVLDPSCPLPAGAEGEGGRPDKAQLFSVQILRSQVFRPQVLRSQIVKTRIHRCERPLPQQPEERTHPRPFPPPLRPPLPKVNNVTSTPSLHRPPATADPLNSLFYLALKLPRRSNPPRRPRYLKALMPHHATLHTDVDVIPLKVPQDQGHQMHVSSFCWDGTQEDVEFVVLFTLFQVSALSVINDNTLLNQPSWYLCHIKEPS